MKKLWTRLTPFTSDTSGALGTLYDLNALGLILDPNGCLSNYMAHDEFRREAKAPYLVSVGQNQMDMILGNEVPLYRGFRQLIQTSSPSLVAMIGTPVTALLSSDLERYAKDMEEEFGIPAIAIHTSGEKFYDTGTAQAYLQLCRRFVRSRTKLKPKHLNLVGVTHLDFGSMEAVAALERQIAEWGWTIQARLGMGSSLEELEQAADAELSLVVSVSGLPAARYLQEQFGVPYVADLPVGLCGAARVQAELASASQRKADAFDPGQEAGDSVDRDEKGWEANGASATLIIGEQISANALRFLAEQKTGEPADVATFFSFEKSLARPGDVALDGESALDELLRERKYKRIIGDPLFGRFLTNDKQITHIHWPHMAVSGQLYAGHTLTLAGPEAENLVF